MKGKNLGKLKSVENFKSEIEETKTLIFALETQVVATKQLLSFTKAKTSPDYHKFKKHLEVSEDQIKKLYELGYVALFANFECFQCELLKDLFKKYPTSFRSEKTIRFEDIKDFENIKEIKDYFVDSLAIDKSYDIEMWVKFLEQKFSIKVFKSKKELSNFRMLNSLRNIILHSGSRTNAKFRGEMRTFIKTPVPLGEVFKLDRMKYFQILHGYFVKLIANLERV